MRNFLVLIFALIFLFTGCSTVPEESDKVKEIKNQRAEEKTRQAEEWAKKEKAEAERIAALEAELERRKPEIEASKLEYAQKRQAEQEERIIAEEYAFQDWESKINSGINAVDDHWESLWQYTLNSASSGAIDAQTVFQNLRELEHKLIDDEMIFQNATVPQEISQAYSQRMNTIRQGFVSWAKLRRKGCENFRLAFMQGNITPQVMQESINIINQADGFMLRSTAQLVELENEINNR